MGPSSSHSYFKKTVTLQDWWLIKPETHDDDTKSVGVAGIVSTSQQNRTAAAVRCFTSAPISKVFDIFELETVDDVCIILQGDINKDRTLQSGFSAEVFKHFVFGFPVFWEEFATSCPKKRSTSICSESSTPSVGCQQVTASSSIEDFNFSSCVPDVNDDPPKANMKACQNKKKNKKEEIPAAHRIDSKKAIMTRSRSKSKVTPQREMAKRQRLIASPKSTSRANKASKDPYGSANIVSPEEFSGKKSRSGRVLLPTLEFWHNQKVVYDKDHQVCGIQKPM